MRDGVRGRGTHARAHGAHVLIQPPSTARRAAGRAASVAAQGAAALAVVAVLTGGAVTPAVDGPTPTGAGDDGPAVRPSHDEVATARLEAQAGAWADRRRGDALALADAALDAADAVGGMVVDDALTQELGTTTAALARAVRTSGWSRVEVLRLPVPTGAAQADAARVPSRSGAQMPADVVTARDVRALADDVFRLSLLVEAAGSTVLPGTDLTIPALTTPRPLEPLPAAEVTPAGSGTTTTAGAAGADVVPGDAADLGPGDAGDVAPDEADASVADGGTVPGDVPAAAPAAGPAEQAVAPQDRPTDRLPAELVAGVTELERAVAAAAGAGAPLRTLEELPVLAGAHGMALVRAGAYADRLPAGWREGAWENGRLPQGLLCPLSFAPQARLRCDAAAALEELDVAYRAHFGTHLEVVSSYRSFEQQVLVKASRGWLAASPGRSNHGWGIAVDLGGFGGVGQFDSPRYLWMREHAPAYGWSHPTAMQPGGSAPEEPWHWEFGTD